jgi:integrase
MAVFERAMRGKTDFVADFYDKTGRHQFGFPTFEQARIHFGTYDIRVRDDQTLADWLRHYREHLPPMSEKLARNSRTCLKGLLALVLTPPEGETDWEKLDLREIELRDVGFRHVEKLYLAASKSGGKPGTVENFMVALARCLDLAVSQYRIATNPGRAFRAFPENRVKRGVKDPDLPFADDYDNIRAELSSSGRIGFGLLTEVGLTTLEAAALEWEDVNLETRAVSVRNAYDPGTNRILPCGNPGSVRTIVDISPTFIAELTAAKALADGNRYVLNFPARVTLAVRRTVVPRRLREELRIAQEVLKIASPRTKKPYTTENFRDRWVTDRLNDPKKHNYVRTQAHAGYANVWAFSDRFAKYIEADDSFRQIEMALGALQALTGMSRQAHI